MIFHGSWAMFSQQKLCEVHDGCDTRSHLKFWIVIMPDPANCNISKSSGFSSHLMSFRQTVLAMNRSQYLFGYCLICLPRLQFWYISFTYMYSILLTTDQTIQRTTPDKTRPEHNRPDRTSSSYQIIFLVPKSTVTKSTVNTSWSGRKIQEPQHSWMTE